MRRGNGSLRLSTVRSPGRAAQRGMRNASVEFARDSRRRALSVLPSLFTLANMLCGFAAILLSISGSFSLGAVFVGMSVVLDIADGAVARLVRSVTPFGLQFDSLADLVSFGVAPAVLAFAWVLNDLGPFGWVASFCWLAAAAIRLARFNVTIDPTADKRFFTGLPSPGAAGIVVTSVFAFPHAGEGPNRVLVLLLMLVPAVLMVTSIRFRSFRALVSPKRPGLPYPLIGFCLVLAVGFLTIPAITGCAVAYGYLAVPLLSALAAPLLRRSPGHASRGHRLS